MRKAYSIFTDSGVTITSEVLGNGVMKVSYSSESGEEALVLLNPNNVTLPITVDGTWNVVATGSAAGAAAIDTVTDSVTISGIEAVVLVRSAE